MKKLLSLIFSCVCLICTSISTAQVGIGTDMPNPSTMLDIRSNNRGVLFPQVALTDPLDQTTIDSGNVESLMVFNTTDNQNLDPGYYYWHNGQWRSFMGNLELPHNIVFWDVINNQFIYLDENGDLQTIDIASLETLTALTLNADGRTLEYTDEDGVLTAIDLGDIIGNLETITSIVNNNNGTYTFTNENGDTTLIDIVGDVLSNIDSQGSIYSAIINLINSQVGTDVFTDNGDGTFTHIAQDGTSVSFDANTLTMVSNGDGTYTFTNANGQTITVDVIADVVTNIQNQGDIYTEIINLINTQVGTDVFTDNGDGTFTHINLDGTSVTFDSNTLTMVSNGDGTYTFTNANGQSITVDVIADVVTNIQNQGDIYTEIINLINTQVGTDVFTDNGDGTFTHINLDGTSVIFDANTLTMVSNGDGTYTFTNANGQTITVDVIADVVTNIQNQGDIYTEIINLINTQVGTDVFTDNGDGTFTHINLDGTSITFDSNTLTMVSNGDGTYTFTNANGQSITVDVIADVVTNIQNQGDIYTEIINLINTQVGTDVFTDNGDGTFTHINLDGTSVTFDSNTLTMVSNGDGTYTFTNANGQTITVDVIADVVTNIQNQGDIYSEIINIVGDSAPKSFVKGTASNPLLLGLTLLNGYRLAQFGTEEFDENNEFNTVTSSFVAQQDGIYSIYFQADSGGLVSAAEFGVGIFKTDTGTGVENLIAEERYLSVNVDLGLIQLDVSPPTRSAQTLVKLNAGDRIRFGIKAPLLLLQILGSNQNMFTIHQVK